MDAAPLESEPSDTDLLVSSRRNPSAFRELYARTSDDLLAFFYRRTSDPHVAADLLAETFATAFEKRGRFKPRKSDSARAWLFGIGRVEVAKYYRKQEVELRAVNKLGMQVPTLSDDDITRIESLVDSDNQLEDLNNALAELSDQDRTAVALRVVDGKDYSEVAEEMGCSAGAARVRVHRTLGRLAGLLEVSA